MKDIQNDKGFLILELTRTELLNAYGDATLGVCDGCLSSPEGGYYVAVLNQWLCKNCYEEWYSNAVFYPEDRGVEIRNYVSVRKLTESNRDATI